MKTSPGMYDVSKNETRDNYIYTQRHLDIISYDDKRFL